MDRRIELIAIGDELLFGEVDETNGSWIGRRLALEGILVTQRSIVGDDVARIRDALSLALRRTRTVICTGGLGPTRDDVTREAVAELYDRAMGVDYDWLDTLRGRYVARGIAMPDINRVQASRPEGATLLHNPRGTAPGLALDDDALGLTILLPGVPGEMQDLMDTAVVPLLVERFGTARAVAARTWRTTGISEAALAERVDDIARDVAPLRFAFLPQGTGVDLRLTCTAAERDVAADDLFDRVTTALRERLGILIYADDGSDLAAVVGRLLRDRGFSIAVAESCTGGLVAKRLTDVPGSSDYVYGGLVTYANAAKQELLGVREETLALHGAVSESCVREMAVRARAVSGADVAVAVSGIAGPEGGTQDKPVGTVWYAVALGETVVTRRFVHPGNRSDVRERAAQTALDMVRRALLGATTERS